MSATLAADDRGLVSLEIAETKDGEPGAVRSYTLAACPPGFDVWAVTLTRLDSGDSYRVAVDPAGRWRCSCPASRHRPRVVCKHRLSVRAVYRLLLSLAPTQPPE